MKLRLLPSYLRWAAAAAVTGLWYVPLMALSFVVPFARLGGLARACFRLSLRALGMRLVVRGLEHLDPTKAYLYVGNHVNFLDPFIFVAGVTQRVVAVEKRENFALPVYGWIMRRWGNIPIDRNDPAAARETLAELVRRLRAGESVCMMPEGTRTRTGEVGAFKSGPFQVAIEAGALVMPFAFRGLDRFNRTDTAEIVPGVVELVFTPAIDAGAYEMSGLRTVLKRARVQTLCALGEGAEPDAVTGTVSGAAAETSAGGDAQRPGGDAHLP